MGTGGAPEGVLTAAAMRCLNGEIFARLVVNKPEHEERCRAMGITDFKQIYRVEGSGARRADHLRRDRRDRRHADARRALLRRRHPHQLGDHAERSAPDPVHRQHPRRRRAQTSRSGSERWHVDDAAAMRRSTRRSAATPTPRRSSEAARGRSAAGRIVGAIPDRHAVRPGRRSVQRRARSRASSPSRAAPPSRRCRWSPPTCAQVERCARRAAAAGARGWPNASGPAR